MKKIKEICNIDISHYGRMLVDLLVIRILMMTDRFSSGFLR